ncbi:MAG: glutathione peroxidase [Marinilabiliales bacterium]|nr:MAG: glutathione peroxidase [Marinilabiliales bacterium]
MDHSIYDIKATTLKGEEISLDRYRGKVLLVVNTASKCGFTGQYEGLEDLYRKYREQGLEILGFPCNQFGNQEPGSPEEIEQGCLVNYGVSFQMFQKTDVNGPDEHQLFKFLKDKLSGFFGSRIKWNFTKFVVGRDGKPLKRFSPATTPEKMEGFISNVIKA